MSGHSKWNNIKAKKAKGDSARSKIFTKIGREIAVAVKAGGADPTTNSTLYGIIQKARLSNMPNDNIQRSIKKASGELGEVNYESIIYEGYGAGGAAVLVECLTDNKNRTAGDVRSYLTKNGGSLGTNNCVSFMFDKKGVIVGEMTEKQNEESIFEMAIECGADDVQFEEGNYVIYTAPQDCNAVSKALEEAGAVLVSAQVDWLPQNTIVLSEEHLAKFNKMIDSLEENDDVQNVYHNVDLPDDDE